MKSIERAVQAESIVRARMDVRVESLYELPGVPLEGPGIKSIGIKVGREGIESEKVRVSLLGMNEKEGENSLLITDGSPPSDEVVSVVCQHVQLTRLSALQELTELQVDFGHL